MSVNLREAVAVLAFSTLLVPSTSASAQEITTIPLPVAEVSAGYTFMRDFDIREDVNFPLGWYASGAFNMSRWFALVAEGTGSYKNDITLPGMPGMTDDDYRMANEYTNVGARVYTLMGGPRFFHKAGRVVPFGQFLVGGAHMRVKTSFSGPLHEIVTDFSDSRTFFSFQPGGGVSVFLTENVGLRFAADYRCIVDFDGEEDMYDNEFRVMTGFVFGWGAR